MNTRLIVLILGLFFLVASFLVDGAAFDIQLYDTYYVIGWGILLRGLGVLSCLTAGIYFLLDRRINRF